MRLIDISLIDRKISSLSTYAVGHILRTELEFNIVNNSTMSSYNRSVSANKGIAGSAKTVFLFYLFSQRRTQSGRHDWNAFKSTVKASVKLRKDWRKKRGYNINKKLKHCFYCISRLPKIMRWRYWELQLQESASVYQFVRQNHYRKHMKLIIKGNYKKIRVTNGIFFEADLLPWWGKMLTGYIFPDYNYVNPIYLSFENQ